METLNLEPNIDERLTLDSNIDTRFLSIFNLWLKKEAIDSSKLQVRLVSDLEANAVHALYAQLSIEWPIVYPTYNDSLEALDWRSKLPRRCFVVTYDDEPIGEMTFDRFSESYGEGPKTGVLISIGLLKEFCGRTIGTRMLQGLITQVSESYDKIVVHLSETNTRAYQFYSFRGFIPLFTSDGEIRMYKPLGKTNDKHYS